MFHACEQIKRQCECNKSIQRVRTLQEGGGVRVDGSMVRILRRLRSEWNWRKESRLRWAIEYSVKRQARQRTNQTNQMNNLWSISNKNPLNAHFILLSFVISLWCTTSCLVRSNVSLWRKGEGKRCMCERAKRWSMDGWGNYKFMTVTWKLCQCEFYLVLKILTAHIFVSNLFDEKVVNQLEGVMFSLFYKDWKRSSG